MKKSEAVDVHRAERQLLKPQPLAELRHASVTYRRSGFGSGSGANQITAVDRVDLTIQTGESLGVVGESGCGKSTLVRALLGLVPLSSGKVLYHGVSPRKLNAVDRRNMRRNMQLVHQDPYSSFDSKLSIGTSLHEPLIIHRMGNRETRQKVIRDVLRAVSLNPSVLSSPPHKLSGGQLQRAALARAYVLQPELLILDEATSSLDVSVKVQIIMLLRQLKSEFGTSFLFISHDIATVGSIADRIAVMYMGRIVEFGSRDEVLNRPQHPYTQALLSAVLAPSQSKLARRERIVLEGEIPGNISAQRGCAFAARCPLRVKLGMPERCMTQEPELRPLTGQRGADVACHFAEDQ